MSLVRICKEPGCKVRLSYYNHTSYCCLHPHVPKRLMEELKGSVVLKDDDWVRLKQWKHYPPQTIEAWKPQMMSETFLRGMEEQIHPQDKKAYEDGSWLN